MLVLTRKTNESIVIDGGIEIMVVQVRGNRVRLGFRAPANVSIQRRERLLDSSARLDAAPRSTETYSSAGRPSRRQFAARPR